MDARNRTITRQKEQKHPRILREAAPKNQGIQPDLEGELWRDAPEKVSPKRRRHHKKKRVPSLSRFYPLFLFLIAGALHSTVAVQMTVPIIVPDELNTLGISAFLSGCDWSSLMSAYANYYGYGQALLVVPLFFLIRDNILLYKVILVFYGIWMALIPVIAWHLMTGVFRRPRNGGTFLWALAIGLFPCYTIYSKFAWNESLIMLLPWITIPWILHCIAQGRWVKEWLLALLLVLGYATHGRYLGVAVSVLFMLWICQKYCRVDLLLWRKLVLWMGFFLGMDALFKWALVKRLWHLSGMGSARNTLSETLGRNALLLLRINGWKNLLSGINGFTFDVAAVSFGLVFVSALLFVHKWRTYALGLFHSVLRKHPKHGVELSFDENWKRPEEEVVYAVSDQTVGIEPKSQEKGEAPEDGSSKEEPLEGDAVTDGKTQEEEVGFLGGSLAKEGKGQVHSSLPEKPKASREERRYLSKKAAGARVLVLETIEMDRMEPRSQDLLEEKEKRRRQKQERREALLESTWLPVDKVHLILTEETRKEGLFAPLSEKEELLQERKSRDEESIGAAIASLTEEERIFQEGAAPTGLEVDAMVPVDPRHDTADAARGVAPADPHREAAEEEDCVAGGEEYQEDAAPHPKEKQADSFVELSSEAMVVTDLWKESRKNPPGFDPAMWEDSLDHQMWKRRRLLAAEFFLGGVALLCMAFAIGIGATFFLTDFGKEDSEYYIIFGRYTEYLLAFQLLYLMVALEKRALPSKVMQWSFFLMAANFSLTYFLEGERIGWKSLAGINLYLLLSYTPRFQLKNDWDLLLLMAATSGVFVLCLVLLRLNFKKMLCLLLTVVFVFSYGHTSYKEFLAMAKTQYGYVDATQERLYSLDQIYKEHPDIYLYNIKSPQIYQLPLRHFHLHKLEKEESQTVQDLKEDSFLISDGERPFKESQAFYRIWLPKTDTSYNRNLWVYGEALHQKLLEKGVKFAEE